jgi:outer membrane protein insertion porin family
LNRNTYFFDSDANGSLDSCDPLVAGRYLCDAIGKRTTSSVGYSFVFDNLNNRIRPSKGQRFIFSQDFAGLGGSVKYLRTRFDADKYWGLGKGFIFNIGLEGGHIWSLENSRGAGIDKVRLTDRFFLGEPQLRGFGIRGVGPRVQRRYYDLGPTVTTPTFITNNNNNYDDALGGRQYYLGHAEIEIPLGSGARELGLRPSLFMDVGSVWGVKKPNLVGIGNAFADGSDTGDAPDAVLRPILNSDGRQIYIVPRDATANAGLTTLCSVGFDTSGGTNCTGTLVNGVAANTITPFEETFLGNTWKPRLSVGFGVNWNSPFGPFRIDIAKALLKRPGDETKLFTFNVGTQF